MTREEKITLLQQIADGRGSIEDLMPPGEYRVFRIRGPITTTSISANDTTPTPDNPNDEEYHQWLKDFEAINSRRKVPHTINVIEIVPDENCKNLYDCKGLANCLNGCGCEWKEDAMSGNIGNLKHNV